MSTSQNEMHIYEMWTDRDSSAGDHMPVKWADIVIYMQKKQDLPLIPSQCVDLTVSTQRYMNLKHKNLNKCKNHYGIPHRDIKV